MRASFIEEAICQKDAKLLAGGAMAVQTGRHEDRAYSSQFFVRDEANEFNLVWGDASRLFDKEQAAEFFRTLQGHLAESRVFEVHAFIGAYPVEFLTTSAWHAAYAETLFRESFIEDLANRAIAEEVPFGTLRIWHDPFLKPSQFEISSPGDALVLIDSARYNIAILGTAYAGEIKEAAFSLLDCLLSRSSLLPLHASANCREDGSGSCLILGASGAGKTTLVHQPNRFLISDDEVIWSDSGISNLEGGCYARASHLSMETTPEIFEAAGSFGSVLENVQFDERTRLPDFEKMQRSENARVTLKLSAFPRVFDQSREASVPESIVLLAADEFGALPAVAKLNGSQACRLLTGRAHQAWSARTGQRISDKIMSSGARLWLINTGWRRGKVEALVRYPLGLTRRLLDVVQSGEAESTEFETHPVFGFQVPKSIAGVDSEILEIPRGPQVESYAAQFFGVSEDLSLDFSTRDSLDFSRTGSARSSSVSRRRFTSGGI